MEIIRNYLETMFQSLPNTPELQKAKYELGQMMEDKYAELKREGKTENEAIGIVISEFGNLDELAQDLGIHSFVKEKTPLNARILTMQEVKDYISDRTRAGLMIGFAVFLCIISPSGFATGHPLGSMVFLFTSIAIAVAIFIMTGILSEKWNFIKQLPCGIDFSSAEYVHNERSRYRMSYALCHAIGVILCILCFVPILILGELNWKFGRWYSVSFGIVLMFAFIGIGVFLFIAANVRNTAYNTLLRLNAADSMGGSFVPSQKEQVRYNNKTLAAIMSVYWPTVTCIYLCWSFLTHDWHITWIIWVIAGVAESFIKNLYRD